MDPALKRLPAYFYRLDSGREPVREWLKELEPEDRRVIGEDIKDARVFVAYRHAGRWSAGPRIVGSAERLAAMPNCAGLFGVEHGRMVLLHGFIKKTRRTPQRDIDLALKRKKGALA